MLFSSAIHAQEVKIDVANRPLDRVLRELGVEISFDGEAVSKYRVTESRTFPSIDDAIEYLLRDKPLSFSKSGDVYIIYPKKVEERAATPKKEYTISGLLIDYESGERLPYAYIRSESGTMSTDENGYFSFKSEEQSAKVEAIYLGYNNIDTTLTAGHHTLATTSRLIAMSEVVINPSPSAMMMQVGKRAGEVRLNHTVARQLPGSGDNSVFNLINLMPGVRASGEPSDDLIVWGSINGESRVTFDGFTLFGLKSFSNNISYINPYMVKDIRLMKGGYDASIGGVVGGVAEITGVDGESNRPSLKGTLSNLTANIFGSIPITKRSVLMASYRQTFYNLYDVERWNPYGKHSSEKSGGKGHGGGHGATQSLNDIYILPDYKFRDVNLKYVGNDSNRDNYHISLYTSSDDFNYSVKKADRYELSALQDSHQYAGSAMYNKVWNNSSSSRLLVSYSLLNSQNDHITKPQGDEGEPEVSVTIKNKIEEGKIELNHLFNWGRHQVELGGEALFYNTKVDEEKKSLTIPSIYLMGNFKWGKFSLNGGIRADLLKGGRLFAQPRLSGRYALSEVLTATLSWGIYRQYISRTPIEREEFVDFVWRTEGDRPISSMHTTAGLAFSKSGFLVSVEGYYKRNGEITRFSKELYKSSVDIWGFDLFLKREFEKVSLFGSYSFSSLSEQVDERGSEVKLGSIFSLNRFTLSASYIFGTGFLPTFK